MKCGKMMRFILPLALIFTFVLSLSGCKTDDADHDLKDITTTSEVTEAMPKVVPEVFLVKDGKAIARVVRSNKASDELFKEIDNLIQAVKSKTGTKLDIVTDWGNGMPDDAADKIEIVIGNTSYDASQNIKSDLKNKQYRIVLQNNKIIICGSDDETTAQAVRYFVHKLIIGQNDETVVSSLSFSENDNFEYTPKYKIQSLTIMGEDVGSYRIVLPQNYTASEYRLAVMLQIHIKTNCGYILPVVYDDTPESTNEILIGRTARTEFEVGQRSYAIKVENKKLYVLAGNLYAYDAARKKLFNEIISSSQKQIELSAGVLASEDITATLSEGAKHTLSKPGDVRIMAANIWGNSSGSTAEYPIAQRNQMLSEVFLEYLPDILTLQECSPAARRGNEDIAKLLSKAYTEVPVSFSNSYNNNYTPIFYLKETLEFIEGGYILFTGNNDVDSKSVTWAVFTTREDSKTFAVMSTHFWYKAGEEGDLTRESNAKQIIKLTNEILTKYNCPVFVTGDLNSNIYAKGTGTLIGDGFVDLQTSAKNTENLRTNHAYPEYNHDIKLWTAYTYPQGTASQSIDHILLKGDAEVLLFDVVTDEYALLSSDHCPIFVDVKLIK